MIIACLHTMASNAALFDAVTPEGVTLQHHVREDLLRHALERGGADESILADTQDALSALSGDAVLLTCSTIGAAAPRAGAIRVDAALAEAAAEAASGGGRIDALATAPSTVEPTRALFAEAAARHGAEITVTLIDGAFDLFAAGDLDGYADLVAAAADRSTADVVALAQASMAPAAERCTRPVLTSPRAGLEAAIKAARSHT